MPKKPLTLALIGRPNVGKSTLFNRLVGQRAAIVEDTPGVTRDRRYGTSDWNGMAFEVIDTGGLEPKTDNEVFRAMRRQTLMAIEEADLALLIVDGRHGMLPQDKEIYNQLRKEHRECFVAVNKIDGRHQEGMVVDFYSLGAEELYPISALHGSGTGDMLDDIVAFFRRIEEQRAELEAAGLSDEDNAFNEGEESEDWNQEEEEYEGVPRIAVIGKPNAGKSTFINQVLGEERLLAMPIPGTTRDAIDVETSYKDKPYLFIDTAGIRRKKYIKEKLEKISIHQSLGSLDRCDVALMMVDATEGITEQDAKVAAFAHKKGRGIVLVVNKWDLMEKSPKAMKVFEERLRYQLKFLHYAPVVFCSALTGMRIDRVFEAVEKVLEGYRYRIPTGELNRFFAEMLRYHPPPVHRGRPIKFYFITQARTAPPSFMISANQPNAAHVTYKRFIMNSLRANFGFEGVPIRLFFRQRT